MQVKDVMTRPAETVGADETLVAAARRMKELGVGTLVVREGEQIVGIVTDRDVVVRAVAEGADPGHAPVRSAMTPQVLECLDADELEDAVTRMGSGAVRRLVVLDSAGRLAGVLSIDDVALRAPGLAGELLEHLRAPERPVVRGPWPWWETPAS